MFDYVRDTNTAMDADEFLAGNLAGALRFLTRFDSVFDVLRPPSRGEEFSAVDIDSLIAERTAAKKARNFARADEIRGRLASHGITLEDTKEGVRWKRQ